MGDLPVIAFIQERLAEADATLVTRAGTGFYDLFIEPQEFMLQPFITAMETILNAQSVSRILALPNPDQFDTTLVDDLVSNVFITRNQGSLATGIVQVLYATPIDIEYPAFTAEFDSGTLVFFNSEDVVVSADQMALQTSGNFYYVNFNIQAQQAGADYNLPITEGITFVNDTNAVTSSLIGPTEEGLSSETNTEVLNRAQNSIGVRDLETIKGINAIIQENFTYISEIQAIGFGDPEMQRDIVYNAHVGGNTDIYLKTPSFQTKTANFIGIGYDFTRNLPYSINSQITASSFSDSSSFLGTPNIVTETVVVTSNVVPTSAFVITSHIPTSYTVSLFSIPATMVAGSTTVTVGSTASVITGLTVTGGGLPGGTIVSTVPNSTTFTLSNPAPNSGTFTLNLSGTGSGINLNLGQWIQLQNDNGAAVNIKIAGANPTQTQRFEIINSINAAIGLTIASEYATDQIIIESPTVGLGSQLLFTVPTSPRTDGTDLLIGFNAPKSFAGITPTVYIENVDYQVDYTDGKIIQLPGGAIYSGRPVAEHPGSPDAGAGIIYPGINTLGSTTSAAFAAVSPGDELTIDTSTDAGAEGTYTVTKITGNLALTGNITSGSATIAGISSTSGLVKGQTVTASGIPSGSYITNINSSTSITINQNATATTVGVSLTFYSTLTVLGLAPASGDSAVNYHVTSEAVQVITYQYNPLSIDVGPNVLLSDGISRGIRPGRADFTITDVAFVDIISIQEIDPVTQQGLGIFLNPPGGFGSGGFGTGSFGIGSAGDYNFIVNVPSVRFSADEDSVIVFNPEYFGSSFQVTYYAATEIAAINTFCTSDSERVTGADVLAKVFIPAFVDMTITVRPNLSNINTPTNAALVTSISTYIKGITATNPVEQSVIEQTIIDAGIGSVQTPFTMTATVINPDGSTTILTSQDELTFPAVTLPSETNNYTTARIIQWYPRNITILGVS